MNFNYSLRKEFLPKELQEVLVYLGPDEELDEFIERAKNNPYSVVQLFLYRFFSPFIPLYDIDAILKIYPLYILGKSMWRRIVPKELQGGKLLDVGAGQGLVTLNAKPIFGEITTTDTSRFVARRLRARGFKCIRKDIAKNPNLFNKKEFDVVSLLNVLDRSEYPITLLKNSISFLKDDGYMIISIPIPIRPMVFSLSVDVPSEILVKNQNGNFEECVADFYENVLKPNGLTVTLLARLPYICQGDDVGKINALDNFLVVCKKNL